MIKKLRPRTPSTNNDVDQASRLVEQMLGMSLDSFEFTSGDTQKHYESSLLLSCSFTEALKLAQTPQQQQALGLLATEACATRGTDWHHPLPEIRRDLRRYFQDRVNIPHLERGAEVFNRLTQKCPKMGRDVAGTMGKALLIVDPKRHDYWHLIGIFSNVCQRSKQSSIAMTVFAKMIDRHRVDEPNMDRLHWENHPHSVRNLMPLLNACEDRARTSSDSAQATAWTARAQNLATKMTAFEQARRNGPPSL